LTTGESANTLADVASLVKTAVATNSVGQPAPIEGRAGEPLRQPVSKRSFYGHLITARSFEEAERDIEGDQKNGHLMGRNGEHGHVRRKSHRDVPGSPGALGDVPAKEHQQYESFQAIEWPIVDPERAFLHGRISGTRIVAEP